MTRLLIAGATGMVGRCVLAQALGDARVSRVIALTRRPIAPHAKLENIVADFAALPAQADYWSVDGVVSALGTTRAITRSAAAYRAIDFDYPLAIARHAREHGATHFALTSSLGADPRSRFVYTRTKGELEAAVTALDYPSLTIVRPSVLDGAREERRPGEEMARVALGWVGPLLPRRWRASPAEAVAACLIEGAVAGPPGVHIRTNAAML